MSAEQRQIAEKLRNHPEATGWMQVAADLIDTQAAELRCAKRDYMEVSAELTRLRSLNAELVEALRNAESELALVERGSVGGVPNSVALLIPEALEGVRAAITRATGGQ